MRRKLTAIVAADVVNYSMFMGQNEWGTISALQTIQREVLVPAASKYHGRIVRLMGDGSLLAFDSALAAVQFAVEVQSILAARKAGNAEIPIELRMGANLCDIIEEKDDIHGDGVNVAVRLEELAPPGGICLSHSIYLQTKNSLGEKLLPIGERYLKNISEPVQVWRWQPPGVIDGVGADTKLFAAKKHFHGRQILDPKVTAIFVDLHMRSACLAVSDCFDDVLAMPDAGRNMSPDELSRRFTDHINHARGLLRAILVECVDNIHEFASGLWQSPQPLSEFVANVANSASYTVHLLPQILAVLHSSNAAHEKRIEIMELIRSFMNDMAPRVKAMIKFSFVEP